MYYRSVNDLNTALLTNLQRLPRDLDLVVGVPRSGLLAANLLSLMANITLTDLDRYVEGGVYSSGTTKMHSMRKAVPGARRVLVLDDSIRTGEAMRTARNRILAAGISDDVIYAAVYATTPHHPAADIVFEVVPLPRLFQWNFMHHVALETACVDIDGVLCLDPTEEENDDGPAYLKFLSEARSLYRLSRPVGAFVTSRLEKYRPQTEAWLARNGLSDRELVMLDLPSKAERQRIGIHGSFKADYYRKSSANLFIESEQGQAETIARLSGKPVLCLETHMLVEPSFAAVLSNLPKARSTAQGLDAVKRALRSGLGSSRYEGLKSWRVSR